MSESKDIYFYMSLAIEEAKNATLKSEVPVGCVLVNNFNVEAKAHNLTEEKNFPLCHAEMIAMFDACKKYKSKYLKSFELYVTMEPCPMCAYAIRLCRIKKVYFGCYDFKNGAFGGNFDISNLGFGGGIKVYGGIMEKECASLLQNFFQSKRN